MICGALTSFCRFDNRIIKLIGIVYCPNRMCASRLCVHKKTFQSIERSGDERPRSESTCQVRSIPFEEQVSSFFLNSDHGVCFFEGKQKSIQDVSGDVYCPGKFSSRQMFPMFNYGERIMKTVTIVCNAKCTATF